MRFLSYYWLKSPWTLVYMLQQTEYRPKKFLIWILALPNLLQVQKRGKLDLTARARLMLAVAYVSWSAAFIAGVFISLANGSWLYMLIGILAPDASILALFITSIILQKIVVIPTQSREIVAARKKLDNMQAVRIAVLGSYGKTSMKEILGSVLAQCKKVAATPGNKNVLISHARWVNKELSGHEEVLIFEYGESEPGDIARLAEFSRPDMAIITGLAPAHLDGYPSLQAIADDLAAIANFTPTEKVFINQNTAGLLKQKIPGKFYSEQGINNWSISDVKVDFFGTSFTMASGNDRLELHTGLIGEHQIGPICAAVTIANELGLSRHQVTEGVAATHPYEHRMQPRQLGGAWIIDDTYNGNIEGMRAGLRLLQSLPGKRKIYITPGLVEQGSETERVHKELGTLIAQASPDRVVLMQNSVTEFIRSGLNEGNYKGEVATEADPLNFYTNIEHFLAAGDVVMMQNDWPDSYK